MNTKKTILAAISIVFIFLMASSVLSVTVVHNSGQPKADTVFYKAYPGASPDVVVGEFLDGETDWLEGPSRLDLYNSVIAAGHTLSEFDPKSEFTFFPINCRDYKLTSGEVNFPLNVTSFRYALSYIYGMDDKQADIFGYYGVAWHYALGNPVPDAQLPYYQGSLLPDTDYAQAWSILQGDGWTVDGEGWLARNGVKARDGETISFQYSTGSDFYPEGPGGGLVRNFNEFIDYINATGPTMVLYGTDFSALVYQLLAYKDFDIIGIGLTNLGKYVDWIFDCFHSDNIGSWGWNFCGIVDSRFDAAGETILTSMNETEVLEAAIDFQEVFCYELYPWIPVRAGLEFCTIANNTGTHGGELTNLIAMDQFGPRNEYSWRSLHWRGAPGVIWPGGSYSAALGDEPHTMNPWTEDTLYGWELIGRGIDSLYATNPVTLTNMPAVATKWTVDVWTSIPELGIVNGSTANFWLRQDVYWQDGPKVTAYDCVNNMRIMRDYQPGRYSSTWANLVYEEADGPYQFNVYFYTTSLYYADYVAGGALLAPKHVMDMVETFIANGSLAGFDDWAPADNAYIDLMGVAPPTKYPWMTQVVGSGPFIFNSYDRPLATGRVDRFEEFYVNAPVIGAIAGDWLNEIGTDYTYEDLLHNMGAKTADEWGTLSNKTVYAKIYEDGALVTTTADINLSPWNWSYSGPYTTSAFQACGLHNVTIETYCSGDDSLLHTYVHYLVTTIREDVNTYNGDLMDFKVDMRDIGAAARAFGSFPGHLRWFPDSDTTGDFKVDMRDIGAIARKFGWSC